MKQLIVGLGLILALFGAPIQAQEIKAGEDYIVLQTPQPTVDRSKVEVREFFSYACPHCFRFYYPMHEWTQNAPEEVVVVRTPVIFNESWRTLAQAFHTAELMNVVDETHEAMFVALHEKRRDFSSLDKMAEFYGEHGVEPEAFKSTFTSFAVDMKMRQSEQLMRAYRVNSTPSVGVNGKYLVSPRTAGSQERMFDVINHLVKLESKALKQ